jgi:hypothetical protein
MQSNPSVRVGELVKTLSYWCKSEYLQLSVTSSIKTNPRPKIDRKTYCYYNKCTKTTINDSSCQFLPYMLGIRGVYFFLNIYFIVLQKEKK